MAWRMAKSLDVLLGQINTLSPNRSKASDGGIGNAEHASRSSDHNPWVKDGAVGVVTARDFTHDPAHGIDSEKLADTILKAQDPRLKYVISNRKIGSGPGGPSPRMWRKYTGANPHDHHFHISVQDEKHLYDNQGQWDLGGVAVALEHIAAPVVPDDPILRVGAKVNAVVMLQQLLNKHGASLKADGDFGPATKAAVVKFQAANGLVADGVVGAYTWRKLRAA